MEQLNVQGDSAMIALRGHIDGIVVPNVVDEDSAHSAARLLVELKRTEKEVKEREAFFIGPLKKHVKTVSDWIRDRYYEPLREIASKITQGLESYKNEVAVKERERVQAQMREEEAARLKSAEQQIAENDLLATFGAPPAPIVLVPATVLAKDLPEQNIRAAGGSVFERIEWDFEVVDINAVPLEYVKREVRRADVLAALKRGVEISGIRGIKKIGIAVRT